MTRAKNELAIFKVQGEDSVFLKELHTPLTGPTRKTEEMPVVPKTFGVKKPTVVATSAKKGIPVSDYELVIGERVVSRKYGAGVVIDTIEIPKDKSLKFVVTFDSGEEKTFLFPQAFCTDMRLESGEDVKIEYADASKPVVKKPVVKRTVTAETVTEETPAIENAGSAEKANESIPDGKADAAPKEPSSRILKLIEAYKEWQEEYPDYIVLKKEQYFWTARGEGAETLSSLLGYKLRKGYDQPFTGGPSLDIIAGALKHKGIKFIAVVGGEIVARFDG